VVDAIFHDARSRPVKKKKKKKKQNKNKNRSDHKYRHPYRPPYRHHQLPQSGGSPL
jgi:hypothetical protein